MSGRQFWVGKRPRLPVVPMTNPERSPTMIQRQGLTLTLRWQHLALLALLTLSHFAPTYRFIEMNLDEDWLTRHLQGD